METPESKLEAINSLAGQATFAISQIAAAKKQRVSDYDERIRLLRDFIGSLLTKRTDTQQLELFKSDEALTPQLAKFIRQPCSGLD